MSHLHERDEKICLNCDTALTGRYCPNCGQENVEPKQSFWHLVGHFVSDVTHFDGKLFTTLKYLLFHPGFLTVEYVKGRRARYIDPIRLYLFVSALFFLVLITFFPPPTDQLAKVPQNSKAKTGSTNVLTVNGTDSLGNSRITKIKDSSDYQDGFFGLSTTDTSVAQYDSTQKAIPKAKRDGYIERYFTRKVIAASNLYHKDQKEFFHRMVEKFAHLLPTMLFLSVPLIAFLLQLLYIRRKQFYFVSHIVFLLHFYCVYFIGDLFEHLLESIGGYARYFKIFISLALIAYVYIAMLHFYKQGWFKTLIKFGIFSILALTTMLILVVIFLAESMLNTAT